MFVGLSAHSFATIANFQWFSKLPSPLNGMVEGNHWDQWFSNAFGVRQPLVTMVFDGCAPLVRRWNGYVPSLKSTAKPQILKYTGALRGGWKFIEKHRNIELSIRTLIFKMLSKGSLSHS